MLDARGAEIFFGITSQKFLVTKPVKVAKPSRGISLARLYNRSSNRQDQISVLLNGSSEEEILGDEEVSTEPQKGHAN